MREKLGVCQWFHYEAFEDVEHACELLQELGIDKFRTGISWADYYRPKGKEWYDWQMQRLAQAGVEVLLSVWHTPPSISESGSCASPPKRLEDYADFIGQVCIEYGEFFSELELWNEPNNRIKWNAPEEDPRWEKFGHMIRVAGERAVEFGRTAVLGGIIPVDHHWLNLMKSYGALEHIPIVAIHGFPEMWGPDLNWEWYTHWEGWEQKVEYIRKHTEGRPVWLTETGLATWELEPRRPGRHELQARLLREAAAAPVPRVYWYSLIDLDPRRLTVEQTEGDWFDPWEYHMGLVTYGGDKKPAFEVMKGLLDEVPGAE